MPRRTALDTVFDNQYVPTPEELQIIANAPNEADLPLDDEDVNQLTEGNAGDLGNKGEREGMDPEDYAAAISAGISNAEDYIDMELSPDREMAARYYRGDPFGNEIDGRSAIVMTEVRDSVLALMPAMLRIFCGTTNSVEFMNNMGTPDIQAKWQTAYINHIIHHDNDGFLIYHNAFKDSLVRKTGIFTWWHEEKETVTEEIHTGLNEEAFAMLQLEKEEPSSDDEQLEYDYEVLSEKPDTTAPGEMPDLLQEDPQDAEVLAMAGMEVPPPQNFIRDVRVVKRVIKKRHRVAAVPPEEFICSPMASDNIDEFQLVGRRQMKTISDLVALGHDETQIRELLGGGGGGNDNLNENPERVDRNGNVIERLFDPGFEAVDESSEWVKYTVVYVLIDKDGDGIAERRKICTVGNNNDIIYDEMIDGMVPFALICPDPEPHTPFGYSLADQTMDMQDIMSEMMRGVLDSLAESIIGRTAIVEGKVNIDDVLSSERDQVIRTKEQGAIWSLSKPFSGMNVMPVMDYLQTVKSRRTGVTMAPAGLDPDVLQSTSTEAVKATVDASQERAELIARIFAEGGIKRLFKGLLQNVVRHQDQKRMIRLQGKPITVDPRAFNADLDMYVNVGLGRGTAGKRIQGLMQIIAQQKEIIGTYGLDNPFVQLNHVSNSLEDLVHEMEFNDASRYFNIMDKAQAEQYAKMVREQPKPPTPEELLYKANSEKLQTDLAKSESAEATKRLQITTTDDRERDKMVLDLHKGMGELLGKFGIQMDANAVKREMEEDRAADALANKAEERVQPLIAPPQPGQG